MSDLQPNSRVILSRQGIEITPFLARFGSVTYSVSNINSVYVSTLKKELAAWLGFAVFLISGFASFVNLGNQNYPVAALCAIIAVLTGWLTATSKPKFSYTLMLKTSSGDQQAYVTDDGDFAQAIKQALETAMTVRR